MSKCFVAAIVAMGLLVLGCAVVAAGEYVAADRITYICADLGAASWLRVYPPPRYVCLLPDGSPTMGFDLGATYQYGTLIFGVGLLLFGGSAGAALAQRRAPVVNGSEEHPAPTDR